MPRKNVLIVDDDESFISSLKVGLKSYSDKYLFHMAENGEQAKKIFKSFQIDTVITDLKMPEMGGFELITYLDKEYPMTKIIAMSAYGTPEIKEQVKNLGCLAFLDKPLDLAQIISAIEKNVETVGNDDNDLQITVDKKLTDIDSTGKDKKMDLKKALEFIRDNLDGIIMAGIIDANQGIPLEVLNNDPNFDPSIPAGMYTNTFNSAVKAFQIVEWGVPSEVLMPGEPNSVIMISLKSGQYFLGVAFKSKTQLGLVRAIINRIKPDIEQVL